MRNRKGLRIRSYPHLARPVEGAAVNPEVHGAFFAEALAHARTGYQLDSSPVMTGLLGEVYALLGKRSETEKVLEQLNRLSKRRYVCSYETAAIYQGLGRKDAALKWLSRAYDERSDCIPWLKVDPAFDGLRTDPRFQDLVRAVCRRTHVFAPRIERPKAERPTHYNHP